MFDQLTQRAGYHEVFVNEYDIVYFLLSDVLSSRFATSSTDERQSLLNGTTVLVLGGPEAELFAMLGATTAVGIDPGLSTLTQHTHTNLYEIPQLFDPYDITQFSGRGLPPMYDITYQHMLLDRGSGLKLPRSNNATEANMAYEIFKRMISMTKPGGLSIHLGDYVFECIQRFNADHPEDNLRWSVKTEDQVIEGEDAVINNIDTLINYIIIYR